MKCYYGDRGSQRRFNSTTGYTMKRKMRAWLACALMSGLGFVSNARAMESSLRQRQTRKYEADWKELFRERRETLPQEVIAGFDDFAYAWRKIEENPEGTLWHWKEKKATFLRGAKDLLVLLETHSLDKAFDIVQRFRVYLDEVVRRAEGLEKCDERLALIFVCLEEAGRRILEYKGEREFRARRKRALCSLTCCCFGTCYIM
jgi:hypothetical protein